MISTVLTPVTVPMYGCIDGTRPINQFASGSARDWAAVAEVSKPARVTPIWMVARKFEESAVSFSTCWAFFVPFFRHLPNLVIVQGDDGDLRSGKERVA